MVLFKIRSPLNQEEPFKLDEVNYWMPVDQYVGGSNMLSYIYYTQIFYKALGIENINEPFDSLFTQGMVCHNTFQNDSKAWVYQKM